MTTRALACAAALWVCCPAYAQVITFESNGLKYQTLTRGGVTVMFAHLPVHVRDFNILQVAVSNGSGRYYVIKPEDFTLVRSEDALTRAWPARSVVSLLIEKGNRNDVIKLVSAYEAALYGSARMKSTNGYEQRRQAALAEVSSTRLKAAAAASAIALVQTRLAPGESTDGAVFFQTPDRRAALGRLVVRTNTDVFEFNAE
ncbi:MAG: hypothetical protein ACE15B_12115 [Bryobacteraceae bacterium]